MRLSTVFFVLLFSYVCFLTRPGESEFRQAVKSSQTESHFASLLNSRMLNPVMAINSKYVVDCKLFTLGYRQKHPDMRYIGILGSFIAYSDQDDIIMIIVCVFVLYYFSSNKWIWRLSKLTFWNPFSWVVNPFVSDSVFSSIFLVPSLAGDGLYVLETEGRGRFWFLLLSTAVMISMTQLLSSSTRHFRGGSTTFVIFLLVYTRIMSPHRQSALFGLELSGSWSIIAQFGVMMGTAADPRRIFVEATTGLFSAIVLYIYFHRSKVDTFFHSVNIPLGRGKDSSNLIWPLIGCNIILATSAQNLLASV